MASAELKTVGSSRAQGDLWSARARDWAAVQEQTMLPVYQSVLARREMRHGARLLDAGCGAGMFCQLARARGAIVSGLDAAEELIAIARERLGHDDFRVGELEDLPYADASFDVVTGFNSFQYAANPANALREARRVAQGATVVVTTWGRAQDCEAAAYLAALAAFLPALPPGAPGPFALSAPGALEELVGQADLEPIDVVDVDCTWRYPDLETALRGLLSAGPAERAVRAAGEAPVRASVAQAIARFQTSHGEYQLENSFRYIVARA